MKNFSPVQNYISFSIIQAKKKEKKTAKFTWIFDYLTDKPPSGVYALRQNGFL